MLISRRFKTSARKPVELAINEKRRPVAMRSGGEWPSDDLSDKRRWDLPDHRRSESVGSNRTGDCRVVVAGEERAKSVGDERYGNVHVGRAESVGRHLNASNVVVVGVVGCVGCLAKRPSCTANGRANSQSELNVSHLRCVKCVSEWLCCGESCRHSRGGVALNDP